MVFVPFILAPEIRVRLASGLLDISHNYQTPNRKPSRNDSGYQQHVVRRHGDISLLCFASYGMDRGV